MKYATQTTGLVTSLLLASSALLQAGEPPAKPNVILMLADDMGYGDPGFNGNKIIQTPNLDEMAKDSLIFERFYSPAPVCSPSRGGCLTGRHPYRYGIWTANEGHLRKEEISLADALQTQGYTTGHFGKWHLGTLTPNHSGKGAGRNAERNYMTPGMHGFEEWFSTEYAVPTWDPVTDAAANPYYHNGQIETNDLTGDDSRVVMDRAIPFIRKAVAEKMPFLAVIWFHAPHEPVVAGPEFRKLYADKGCDEGQQNYYGCITAEDVQIGRLRKELRALGVADNTMLWFASDNGPEGDEIGGTKQGSAGTFRGRKRSLWEGGVHVPGLLEWPARIKPGATTAIPCSGLDYFPTTLDVLGFCMKGQPEPIDGVSLVPLFAGKMKARPVPIPFETLGGTGTKTSRGSPRMALVDNRFKLLTDMEGPQDQDLLFDLLADPNETTNLVGQFPSVVKTMKQTLWDFRESCKRSLAGKDYATPFTPDKYDIHPSDPGFTRGRDGGGEEGESGSVKRRNKARKGGGIDSEGSDTNAAQHIGASHGQVAAEPVATQGQVAFQDDDSGLVNLTAAAATPHGELGYRADQNKIGRWSNEKDWLSWEFKIHQPGKFQVEVSCGQTQDGSIYEISVADQKIQSVVSASGDFRKAKAQIAGELNIAKSGPYTLALKPISKNGQVVMTLWSVNLVPEKNQ